MLQILKGANLALAFFIELAVLVAIAVWGFYVGQNLLVDVLLGIGGAVVWATLWGVVAAPNAKVTLDGAPRLAFEVVWFGAGVLALVFSDHPVAAAVLAVVWVVNAVLVRAWGQTTAERKSGMSTRP